MSGRRTFLILSRKKLEELLPGETVGETSEKS